jgi:ankyrin repeat protein
VEGNTPLYKACTRRNIEIAQSLIEEGADVNTTNDVGETPLGRTCQFGLISAARLLIEGGADVNKTSKCGLTPLHIACEDRYGVGASLIELLLESAPDFEYA